MNVTTTYVSEEHCHHLQDGRTSQARNHLEAGTKQSPTGNLNYCYPTLGPTQPLFQLVRPFLGERGKATGA
jgi:hypothetical protein